MLMKIPSNPMSFIGRNEGVNEKGKIADSDRELREEKESEEHGDVEKKRVNYLDTKTSYLDPPFLMAWWNLREHIENYELNYFFEVCSIAKNYFIAPDHIVH